MNNSTCALEYIPRTLDTYLKNIYTTLCGLPLKLIVLAAALCAMFCTPYITLCFLCTYILFISGFCLLSCWAKNTNENFKMLCARALRHSSSTIPLVFFMSSARFFNRLLAYKSLFCTDNLKTVAAVEELCVAAYSSLYSPLVFGYTSSSLSVHWSLSFGQHIQSGSQRSYRFIRPKQMIFTIGFVPFFFGYYIACCCDSFQVRNYNETIYAWYVFFEQNDR